MHVSVVGSPPGLDLSQGELSPLFSQGDPDPEPADHLDKDKGEENTVFEGISTPARGAIAGRRGVGRGVGQAGG